MILSYFFFFGNSLLKSSQKCPKYVKVSASQNSYEKVDFSKARDFTRAS